MTGKSIVEARDLEALRRACAEDDGARFVFFWGPEVPKDGSVSGSCLSQWYPTPFQVDGVRYPTAEYFMMAEKARVFRDRGALKGILAAPSPKAAKAIGRQVSAFQEDIWTEHRCSIAVRGNLAKFS